MKYLAIIAIILLALVGFTFSAHAATILFPTGGGTGKGTFTAGLLGASGTNPFFTQATTTVSCSGSASCTPFTVIGASPITISASGSSGTGNVATSSAETNTYIPFWTSTAGTPALLSGGTSNFTWDGTKLFASQASTTQLSVSGNTYLNSSLTGFLKGTSGLVSAVSSIVPADISLTKGNFLVGNDAGVAQATSTIFISSTGNVGIGTTNPGGKFEVVNSTLSGVIQRLTGNNSYNLDITSETNSGGTNGNRFKFNIGSGAGEYLFSTSGGDRMIINSSGNVGIGTASPLAKLHVVGANTGVDSFGQLAVMTSDTFAADVGAELALGGGYSASATTTFAGIAGRKENSTSGDFAGYLQLFTSTNGSGNAERMRVTSAGNVGIGTIAPGAKLEVTGDAIVKGSGLTTLSLGNNSSNFGTQFKLLGYANSFKNWQIDVGMTGGNFNITPSTADGGTTFTTPALSIDRLSNVGIGTTTPAALFSVAGTGYFTTGIGIGVASPTNSLKIVKSGQGYNSEGTPAIRIMDTVTGNTALQMGVDDTLNIGFIQAMQPLTSFSTRALVLQGNGGKVGIGTTSPSLPLSVSGNSYFAGSVGIGTNNPQVALHLLGNTARIQATVDGSNGVLQFYNTAGALNGDLFASGNGFNIYAESGKSLSLGSGGSSRLSIDSSGNFNANSGQFYIQQSTGNVGIGTTNPGTQAEIYRLETADRTTYSDLLTISAGASTIPYTGHGGGILFRATNYYNSSGALTNSARIGSTINDNSIINSGADLFFDVAPLDDGVLARAMTIKYNGNVGIGTTTPILRLSIANNSADGLSITNTSQTANNKIFAIQNTGSTLRIAPLNDAGSATADGLQIDRSGNVGIGTTTPGTILSIGDTTNAINLSNTATSTFAFGIKLPALSVSSFIESVNVFVSSILRIPYGTAPTVATNGDIGIDSTSNQFKFFSGGAVKVLGNGNFYPAFTYATSTAWTGTTTIPLGPAYIGETWNGVKCFTDTGTVNVSFYDGTNRMNMFNASTTVGTVGLVTNNTFTASETRYVDVGTPASSPTKISCTISKSLTAD